MKIRDRQTSEPPAKLLPPGTLLMRCEIPGRAIPWKAPTVGQYGTYKNRRLGAWQEIVGLFAGLNRRIGRPYAGPVEVAMTARFARGPIGDACNLLKAVEDAMEGIIYINDKQVVRNGCGRSLAGYDLVTIEVKTAEPADGGKANP